MTDFINALGVMVQPDCLLLMVVGALIGLILGSIPGLSGALAITAAMIPRIWEG